MAWDGKAFTASLARTVLTWEDGDEWERATAGASIHDGQNLNGKWKAIVRGYR